MEDGTTDTMRVRFPASADYARIGRVAVAGLALRLGVDVQRVESLRLAVDAAVAALQSVGYIVVEASWSPGRLRLDIDNDDAMLTAGQHAELTSQLEPLVDEFDLGTTHIELRLESELQP